MKLIILSVQILVLFVFLLSCKKTSTVEPNKTLSQELQIVLDDALEANNVRGASVAVIVPDDEMWIGVSGISYDTTPISPDMIFNIGGITTNFIAATVLQLTEECILTLEDSLHQWLPPYNNVDSTITIHQLLSHRSGVFEYNNHPYYFDSLSADWLRRWTPEETILTFVQEPYFSPGTRFRYSNTNYILLGMIIEATTGSNVSAEIRNRFLEPLGLNRTYFAVEEELIGEIVHGWYDMPPEDGTLDDISTVPKTAFFSIEWTAGAMFSTAEDIARWGRALLQGNVLNQSSLDQMLLFQPILVTAHPEWEYGLGITSYGPIYLNGVESIGQGGGNPGYCVKMLYLPDYEIYITVMLNERNEVCLDAVIQALTHKVLNQ